MRKNVDPTEMQPFDYNKYDPTRIYPNGQISLFPRSVMKSRGEVVNTVFLKQIKEKIQQEIDDVYERNGQELPVQARIVIEYSQLQVTSALKEDLNGFDWEVMDAILTLSESGKLIYLDSIYRVIVGKKNKYPVTEKQRYMVNESIEKMQKMAIRIDIADLWEKDSPIGSALQEVGIRAASNRNYLLPCEIREYQDIPNGYVYAIRLLSEPPLLTYAKALGLASLYPLTLIDTPLVKTRNTIVLQSYLLRRIDQMYRDRDNGNEMWTLITASNVYFADGSVKDSDTEKARTRKKVIQILNFWKSEDYISGYQVIQTAKNRVVSGYQIYLSPGKRYWNYPEISQQAYLAPDGIEHTKRPELQSPQQNARSDEQTCITQGA